MSSGQKSAYEQTEAEEELAHIARLEKVSAHQLLKITKEINRAIEYLDNKPLALSRGAWRAFDSIKAQMELLR